MNGISLQSLRMFLAVVERGSVSAAGRELDVSQPAVSGHVHSLEERFGIVLLDRGRPMTQSPTWVRTVINNSLRSYGLGRQAAAPSCRPRWTVA